MTVDPRLVDRRRKVAEDRARSNLSRLLRLLAVLAALAFAAWVLQSPLLSVATITVTGADHVDVAAVLTENEITAGRPMIVLDIGAAEGDLRSHSWVEDVRVARQWPTRVLVEVTERVPAASVRFAGGWTLVAAGGVVLEEAAGPDPVLPQADLAHLDRAGDDELLVAGAVEFLSHLPPEQAGGATVRMGSEGLEATVNGFLVRLGGPFDMADKAAVTAELLRQGLETGSTITVVAPASPAVLPPGATTGGEDAEEPDP